MNEKELLERIEKIIKYDLKNNEKSIYERDLKDILEMIENQKNN